MMIIWKNDPSIVSDELQSGDDVLGLLGHVIFHATVVFHLMIYQSCLQFDRNTQGNTPRMVLVPLT